MYSYQLEHICSYKALLNPDFEVIGPTPEGLRVNVYITGGEVTGPRLNGKILPVGADWLIIRPDGMGILNVRLTIETNDGALIYLRYGGVADLGEDGHQRFLDGNPPTRFPLHTVPTAITSHSDYLWLNRVQLLNIGEADLSVPHASYDVYAVR